MPRSLEEVHLELLASLTPSIHKDLSEHGVAGLEFGQAAVRTRTRLEMQGRLVVERADLWTTPDLIAAFSTTFGEAFLLGMRWQKERQRRG